MGDRRRSANGRHRGRQGPIPNSSPAGAPPPEQAGKPQQAPVEPRPIRRICVYCGSSPGRNPVYVEAARRLGAVMAQRNIGLVYGGGGLGLMGEVARAVLAGGGEVTGIIPEFLSEKEHMLREVTDLV